MPVTSIVFLPRNRNNGSSGKKITDTNLYDILQYTRPVLFKTLKITQHKKFEELSQLQETWQLNIWWCPEWEAGAEPSAVLVTAEEAE